MLFNDKDCTYIFLDRKNWLLGFNKRSDTKLEIKTPEVQFILYYDTEILRDEDYKKLLEKVKEKC